MLLAGAGRFQNISIPKFRLALCILFYRDYDQLNVFANHWLIPNGIDLHQGCIKLWKHQLQQIYIIIQRPFFCKDHPFCKSPQVFALIRKSPQVFALIRYP
jgi:hypothetical protein